MITAFKREDRCLTGTGFVRFRGISMMRSVPAASPTARKCDLAFLPFVIATGGRNLSAVSGMPITAMLAVGSTAALRPSRSQASR
eukprot:SAG22_NODE_1249_length_5012_cov_1.781396_5_plen_85_part_00